MNRVSNFISKVGQKAAQIGRGIAAGVAKYGPEAIKISKRIGELERNWDYVLDLAKRGDLTHDLAVGIENNSVYRALRDNLDKGRNFLEGPEFEKALKIVQEIDKAVNKKDIISRNSNLNTVIRPAPPNTSVSGYSNMAMNPVAVKS